MIAVLCACNYEGILSVHMGWLLILSVHFWWPVRDWRKKRCTHTVIDVQNMTKFLGNPMFLLFDHILFYCGKK